MRSVPEHHPLEDGAVGGTPLRNTRLLLRMRNAWRITRWDPGAGTPTYLLASAFTVTPSLCAQATRVDCVIDSSNSIRGTTNFRHFAHAAESLLACWSFFRRYPAARPRLVLKDLRSIDGVIWAESLVRLMGCEVLSGIRAWQYYLPMATLNAAGCAVRGALRQRSGNGYKGREAPRRPKHIRTHKTLLFPSHLLFPPRLLASGDPQRESLLLLR